MLDINLLREEKGGSPELVRASQKKRFGDVTLVDQVIAIDLEWRQQQFKVDNLRADFGKANKEVAAKKKAKEDADDLIAQCKAINADITAAEVECDKCIERRDELLGKIGNIVPDSVPVSDNEDENAIIRSFALDRTVKELDSALTKTPGKLSHVDLVPMLGIANTEIGTLVAGPPPKPLNTETLNISVGVQALISYGLAFLCPRGYTPIQTPFFMQKDAMAAVAQLSTFDEELYKVTGEGEDKYLIATSEQPLCAMHRNTWQDPKVLPTKYVGLSTCFRKEVGSHGRDTLGIFRVHQFEKIEQFCVTSPEDDASWTMLEEMIGASEDFYQSLGIPYRTVAIVSGALNDSAAKKSLCAAMQSGPLPLRPLVSCAPTYDALPTSHQ
ncbi:hypothetical protein T484DRAFT_1664269, partial [Baffinella frigidus]